MKKLDFEQMHFIFFFSLSFYLSPFGEKRISVLGYKVHITPDLGQMRLTAGLVTYAHNQGKEDTISHKATCRLH